MNIVQAIDDPQLFGRWFEGDTWAPWRVTLKAIFGLPMSNADLGFYRRCTGRSDPPEEPATEFWAICGRRSGKSFILALVAAYLAAFRNWIPYLGPGERGTIQVIASDRRQARVILRYIDGLLAASPMLEGMVEGQTANGFDLANRVTIEIHSASFRAVRGYTVLAALCDELAFWRSDESANPDREILEAIRPAMATIPGSMLLCASSPYSRRGALWDAHRRYYGQPGPVLVWKAATREMNPRVPERVIEEALDRDEASARSEYLAEFRSDLEAFISREVIEKLIEPGVHERGRVRGVRYHAFCDPSGGSNDSFTLAIGHREGELGVLDCTRERRAPFNPEQVTQEYADVLKSYGVTSVSGDRYSAQWVQEQFRKRGIRYVVSERTKSQIYLESLALFNSAKVDLLDSKKLVGQLIGLERRTSRGGRELVDHPPMGADDVANAVCGCLVEVAGRRREPVRLVPLMGV